MVKEVKYGVISDIHSDPEIIVPTLKFLKSQGVERLLVNGDIGGWQGDLFSSQKYTAYILSQVATSGLPSYVQPGSHEPLAVYGPIIDAFSSSFKNIIDTTKNPKIDDEGHSLVFIPGSDFLCGGEYNFGNSNIPTGTYVEAKNGLRQINNWDDYKLAMETGGERAFHYTNVSDLKRQVTHPEKTIVVCHVPRKFSGLETCVDMAEFGEVAQDFRLNGDLIKKGTVFPLQAARQVSKAGYPVVIKKENRGNSALAKIYEELGITKAVSGHFHESSHRANDRKGDHVSENQYTNELFWNSGHLDAGYTGILTVKGEEVKYQNIDLRNYSK